MEEEDVVGSRSRATIDKSDMRGFCCTQFTIRLHSALCTLCSVTLWSFLLSKRPFKVRVMVSLMDIVLKEQLLCLSQSLPTGKLPYVIKEAMK